MIHVVIGAGYGDEGKGKSVAYFTKPSPHDTIVVRFNGGSQAGHTVETDSFRHVFSHFGSGTIFGARTYLSRHFVSSPIFFAMEYTDLQAYYPRVIASPLSKITTYFDVVINILLERSRGNTRHGSVGAGFGETIERNTYQEFRWNIDNLMRASRSEIIAFIKRIREEWFTYRLDELGLTVPSEQYSQIYDNNVLEKFADDCEFFRQVVKVEWDETILSRFDNIVFEGAQGLMLDQDYGNFPHVTRSNTGLKNVVDLLLDDSRDIHVHYITRAYTTKHGAGEMPFEESEPVYNVVDPTNKPNPHQGSLRFSYLNLDDLKAAIQTDKVVYGDHRMRFNGVMTCLDQLENKVVYAIKCGQKKMMCIDDLKKEFGMFFNGDVLDLRGPKV